MFADGRAALKSIIQRIERLEEEKKAIADDIKEVYAEAKSKGLVPKIIRKIVSLRRQDAHERAEEEALLAVYMNALGMTPIEQAIAKSEEGDAVVRAVTTSKEEFIDAVCNGDADEVELRVELGSLPNAETVQ